MNETVDRRADLDRLARKYLQFAYTLSSASRGMSAAAYVRTQLDRLGVGREVTCIRQGQRRIPLPPSTLPMP